VKVPRDPVKPALTYNLAAAKVGPDLKVATLLQRYLLAFDVNMQVQDAAGKSVSAGMPSGDGHVFGNTRRCCRQESAYRVKNKRGNERERRHK
jgi:hypothetical protein